MRRSLDLGGLSDFEPRRDRPKAPEKPILTRKEGKGEGEGESWPSREPAPVEQTQLNMRVDRAVSERFKRLCRDDRRTYNDMLGILMDAFEGNER